MKILEITRIEFSESYPGLNEISEKLDSLKEKNRIGIINWNTFSYQPDVAFSISYTDREILLKYYITETYFKAEKTESNEMVYEDSCVEFFVSPGDDGIYYNLEFNGIGTCLFGSGKERTNRKKANPLIISKIRRETTIGIKPVKEQEGEFSWSITIAFPLSLFFHHKITELKGKIFSANFYKCGDNLKVPHYLTWNQVRTAKPDFHQPDYFGLLKFL